MQNYKKAFLPYALSAFLIGIVGGFSTVLAPAFVQDIGIGYTNTTWTALAQAVPTAACAPILGSLADRLGRKRTLVLGLAVFTCGNLMTALANSLFAMLAARFTVGLGTAAVAPVILSFIVTDFPAERVAKGFSAYMLISSASVVFGPTLGSVILQHWGWRRMMGLCCFLCIAVLLFCLCKKEKAPPRRPAGRTDAWGAVWVVIFFGSMLCLPAFLQNLPFPAFLLATLTAALSLLALVKAERRAENPILPASFLRRKRFVLSILALFLTQGLMQANMTNTIVFVRYTRAGQSALSGLSISVMYLAMSIGAIVPGSLADRREPKTLLTLSLLLTALGCGVMFLFSSATPLPLLMLSLGCLGLGLGGNGTVFMKVVFSDLPEEAAGRNTGTYGLFRDLAAPFGVAVLVPLFTNSIPADSGAAHSAEAAVFAMHTLAAVETACVIAAIILVRFLPKIHEKEGNL